MYLLWEPTQLTVEPLVSFDIIRYVANLKGKKDVSMKVRTHYNNGEDIENETY